MRTVFLDILICISNKLFLLKKGVENIKMCHRQTQPNLVFIFHVVVIQKLFSYTFYTLYHPN